MKKIKEFFQNVFKEVKKVKWPTIKEVTKNTASTIFFCIFLGLFFYLVDLGFSALVGALS